jgi:hypothetical protein
MGPGHSTLAYTGWSFVPSALRKSMPVACSAGSLSSALRKVDLASMPPRRFELPESIIPCLLLVEGAIASHLDRKGGCVGTESTSSAAASYLRVMPVGPNLGKNLRESTPLGVLTAIQPGPRFQQIGDGDGGASPIPGKSGTGTGERPRGPRALSHPGHWQIGDEGPVPVPGRPVPVPGQIEGGDRGVRALHCAIVQPRLYASACRGHGGPGYADHSSNLKRCLDNAPHGNAPRGVG